MSDVLKIEAIKIQDWDSVRRESNSLKGTTR